MNEDLISSAVTFLKDPNVSTSPLTKKVEFLESKGLNQTEIEEALKRANNGESNHDSYNAPNHATYSNTSSQNSLNSLPVDYYNMGPPDLPERSWKDYFIMATATAGVSYGLYQVVTRYLIPSIIPPSQSAIDEDKDKINEEFIKIEKTLEELSKEQEEIKSSNEKKLEEIDVVIDNVNDFLGKYNKDKLKFDDDLKLMKLEVDNLKNSVEKNMSLTKENIRDDMQDINEELRSLKQLISNRSEKNGEATQARKIPPVSSIPSASEILKRAKPKSQADSESMSGKSNISSSTTMNNVTAAGIPQWQLKSKQKEEKEQKKEQIGNDPTANSIQTLNPETTNNSDVPEEFLEKQTPPLNQMEQDDDTIVNESIKNIGVPSWQLNSTNNSSN